MTATLGTVQEYALAEIARYLGARQQISVFVLETRGGWHSLGFHGDRLVWQSETGLGQDEQILTLFGATSGKFSFHRSQGSSDDGLRTALDLLQKGRLAAVHSLRAI